MYTSIVYVLLANESCVKSGPANVNVTVMCDKECIAGFVGRVDESSCSASSRCHV